MTTVRRAGAALAVAWRAAPVLLLAYLGGSAVAGLMPVATVWLLKLLLDAVSAGSDALLVPTTIGFVVAGLLTAALPAATRFSSAEIERAVGRCALSDLYTATARCLGLHRLEDPGFRDALRMARQTGKSAPGQVVQGLVGLVQGLVGTVGMFAVLASVSPFVAVVTIAGLGPALVAEIFLGRARVRTAFRLTPTERREFFYAELQTSIAAGKELRLLGLSELFRLRMLDELTTADGHRRLLDRRTLRTQSALALLSAVILGGAIAWLVAEAGRGRLSVGDISAFITAMGGLQAGLAMQVGRISLLNQSLLLYGHHLAVLDAEPDLALAADPQPVPPLRHGIELRDVWFRYSPDHDWILRGVNLTITHGTATALVGLNGAGKSTLVKLLCRFYDPVRGAVLWDGVDLRELSVTALRDRIGALFQDYMSYELTAGENIGLGDIAALTDQDRIRAAARRAGIAGVLEAFPRGYATMLSRSFVEPEDPAEGVLLSGGQWQRLALARTFLRDRRDLLILDEPSSGLDADAEAEIHRGLRSHRDGATSILISHRLGAVRDADHIVVLADGRITEQGDHSTLLAAGGVYARLFTTQAEGYRAESVPVDEGAVGELA